VEAYDEMGFLSLYWQAEKEFNSFAEKLKNVRSNCVNLNKMIDLRFGPPSGIDQNELAKQ
jgi:hypothetical protein